MAWKSFYDILEVDKSATLEEIKLAFKRRALQVHPDKGGSKEAFHLVYEALETLADPAARKKYDHGLATGKSGNLVQPQPDGQTGKKKTSKKRGRSAASKAHPKPEKTERPKPKAARGQAKPESETPQAPQSKQTKLLIRIRDLLKQLPRDVRNDVFTKQFSQKQRLILEKWMVDDASSRPQGRREAVPLPLPEDCVGSQPLAIAKLQHVSDDEDCDSAVQPLSTLSLVPSQKATTSGSLRRNISGSGNIKSDKSGYGGYSARICFDALQLSTKYSDLQTALEFLVILTSVKQRMLDSMNTPASFEERMEEALTSSAREQGRSVAELNMRFRVFQSGSFLIGRRFQLHSPVVRSVQELGKLRSRLEPFRQYAKNVGSQSIYWWYSPAHLQDAWERFQLAVADAWQMAGVDSASYIQKLRSYHQATAAARQRFSQSWERQHMAMQDKNKYRPNRLRQRSATKNLELKERWQMAIEDKHEHRPKPWRKRVRKRTFEKMLRRKLLILKKLLARWECMLRREARLLDKERRRILQHRKAKRKKDQEDQRRQQALNRKRLREEELLRREAARQRARSGLFMDHLRWA